MTTVAFRRTASRRILAADANPALLSVLTNTLECEGYNVVAVRDGREAFRVLQTDSDFVVAVFDVDMPHITGLDLLRHMQTERRLMRIPVMMTVERDPQGHLDCLSAGAAVFLPKPFTPAQLRLMIKVMERNRPAPQKRTAA
jgi:two-component system, cell cycle response regulator DivK